MFKLFVSIMLLLVMHLAIAQTPITKESFYKNANSAQIAVVTQFLRSDSVKLNMKDFVFATEEDMDTSLKPEPTEPMKKSDFKFMPFDKTNTKCLDLGFTITYDKEQKKYITEGDHGQFVSIIDFSKKTVMTIWESHGWFPATDYGIWFGKDAVALLVCNKDMDDNPKVDFNLIYYNLATKKKRYYTSNKKLGNKGTDFWDFYFDKIIGKKKK